LYHFCLLLMLFVWFAFLFCIWFVMTTCKDDSLQYIGVQLDDKNYSYWNYVMKKFLREKSIWCYISGVKAISIDIKTNNYVSLEKLISVKLSLRSIILPYTWLVFNGQNMILQRRYEITYLDCIHNPILPNNINLR